jgi:hypothetical protein
MNVPMIRIDICVYYIVMVVLAVALIYSRMELLCCRDDFAMMQDRLVNSVIVKLPPVQEKESIPKLKEMEKQNPIP